MTPPPSLIDAFVSARPFRTFRSRALIFGLAVALTAVLAVFPERYRAAVTLTPTDPQSLGLSGTLGQLGAINNVFGNQAAVEIALRVSKSVQVREIVISRLNLEKRLGMSRLELHRYLQDRVEQRSLRGGIIQIEMTDRDSTLARDVVAAYSSAMQSRLAEISQSQTTYKRNVLQQLVTEASTNLARAQTAFDAFRLKNDAPNPLSNVDVVSMRIPQIEGTIKAKQVALATARKLYTDDNTVVQQMLAEIEALRVQLVQVRERNPEVSTTVGNAVATSSALFKLERDLNVQRALYDSYLKFLQGTAVENLTSTANIRILEPPFIDTDRQIWWPAAAVSLALLLIWGMIEFYRQRPPVGSSLDPVVP